MSLYPQDGQIVHCLDLSLPETVEIVKCIYCTVCFFKPTVKHLFFLYTMYTLPIFVHWYNKELQELSVKHWILVTYLYSLCPTPNVLNGN